MPKPSIWPIVYAEHKKTKQVRASRPDKLESTMQALRAEVADLHSIVRLLNVRLAKLERNAPKPKPEPKPWVSSGDPWIDATSD
jgi:hypothetical protein